VADWAGPGKANTALIADTFRRACDVAEEYGERLAAEGEICWGGMHSWREMLKLLELVNRPKPSASRPTSPTPCSICSATTRPRRAGARGLRLDDKAAFDAAYTKLTDALRPWTIDFHVAQNDATVKGQGSHDKTGKHCPPKDPNGKLDIAEAAGYWLRGADGQPTAFRHICWDGCMFSNDVMLDPQIWNDVLAAMIAVRNAHGWE
jgi:hypothetical protein